MRLSSFFSPFVSPVLRLLWTNNAAAVLGLISPLSSPPLTPVVHIDSSYVTNVYHRKVETSKRLIPPFRVYSRYHHDILYDRRYGQKISYAQYCLLEEALALDLLDVTTTSHNAADRKYVVIVFDDPWWMDDESVISYWTKKERSHVDRRFVLNLDTWRQQGFPSLPIIRQETKTKDIVDITTDRRTLPIMIWNPFAQPRM